MARTKKAGRLLNEEEGDDADHVTTEPTAGPREQAPLSRKAQKKLLKQQQAKEATMRKRIAKKESRKSATAKKREESARFLQQLSEEEQAALKEEAKIRREARMQAAALQKQKVQEALQSGLRIVVDLNFDDKMTDKEIKSLCQQLSYCYSVNSRAECPAHLHFTSLGGRIRETLGHQSTGFSGWAATLREEPYEELFADRKKDLIYLSADASETLETLDPEKVYLIGGIVDRNRYKGLCQKKAEAQGIATARLPIKQHINLSGTQVLTVNQVYAIMLHWLACRSWAEAVEKAVPLRKRLTQPKDEGEAPQEGDEGETLLEGDEGGGTLEGDEGAAPLEAGEGGFPGEAPFDVDGGASLEGEGRELLGDEKPVQPNLQSAKENTDES